MFITSQEKINAPDALCKSTFERAFPENGLSLWPDTLSR
jgi:hypothetical protein